MIGFTGTQRGMTVEQYRAFWAWLRERTVTWFHHGDCVGGDAHAHAAAMDLGFSVALHPPLNPSKRAFCLGAHHVYPERDYMDRNDEIVRMSDVMVAAPGEYVEQLRSGTWATVRRARKAGKPLTIIYPDGSVL